MLQGASNPCGCWHQREFSFLIPAQLQILDTKPLWLGLSRDGIPKPLLTRVHRDRSMFCTNQMGSLGLLWRNLGTQRPSPKHPPKQSCSSAFRRKPEPQQSPISQSRALPEGRTNLI